MVILAADRLNYWHQLRELAGFDVPDSVHESVTWEAEAEYDKKLDALRKEYDAKLLELKTTYPRAIARRMAEGLLKLGDGEMTVSDLLTRAETTQGLDPIGPTELDLGGGSAAAPSGDNGAGAPAAIAVAEAPAPVEAAPAAVEEEDDDDFGICNECTNLNPRLFGYDENKQAYIKDIHAGTYAQLVQGAERCPAGIIHPGDPVNPKEKDLQKWIARAEPFN
jgi:pyruvate-ferredoxin/flavodoxin oxidoreductase